MFEYLIGGFVLGIFASIAIAIAWVHYWDTHGEKPFKTELSERIRNHETRDHLHTFRRWADEVAALKVERVWMRREIERVGRALFTGAHGYVGTEDDLKAVGQTVEGVCETMEKDRADNLRFIIANAEVANLNANLQIENIRLGEIEKESAAVIAMARIAMARSFANFPSWLEGLEAALNADLSKLTTQQKPTEEAMLRANPSCGMDGCLWEEDSNSA